MDAPLFDKKLSRQYSTSKKVETFCQDVSHLSLMRSPRCFVFGNSTSVLSHVLANIFGNSKHDIQLDHKQEVHDIILSIAGCTRDSIYLLISLEDQCKKVSKVPEIRYHSPLNFTTFVSREHR